MTAVLCVNSYSVALHLTLDSIKILHLNQVASYTLTHGQTKQWKGLDSISFNFLNVTRVQVCTLKIYYYESNTNLITLLMFSNYYYYYFYKSKTKKKIKFLDFVKTTADFDAHNYLLLFNRLTVLHINFVNQVIKLVLPYGVRFGWQVLLKCLLWFGCIVSCCGLGALCLVIHHVMVFYFFVHKLCGYVIIIEMCLVKW